MSLIYLVGAAIITGAAILITLAAISSSTRTVAGGFGILSGLILLTFGNLFWRIACEALVVIFKINDSLISIDAKMKEAE